MEGLYPEKIELISDTVLSVKWSDGHDSVYFAAHLRESCPCADCETLREGAGSKEKTGPFQIGRLTPEEMHIHGWEMIGRYAISFKFSDGHDTGIYTYEYLRSLCQCDICTGNVVRIQGPMR